jgi:flagellar basal-body rod protein FlgB
MAISDIPILSMLRTRMNWQQQRQKVLADNVANSDTPNYQPRDLVEPTFGRSAMPGTMSLTLARTAPGHLGSDSAGGGGGGFETNRAGGFEVKPAGNAVSLEDQMMKVAANQMDYQAATTLYARSLGLIKTALGRA